MRRKSRLVVRTGETHERPIRVSVSETGSLPRILPDVLRRRSSGTVTTPAEKNAYVSRRQQERNLSSTCALLVRPLLSLVPPSFSFRRRPLFVASSYCCIKTQNIHHHDRPRCFPATRRRGPNTTAAARRRLSRFRNTERRCARPDRHLPAAPRCVILLLVHYSLGFSHS